MEWKDQLTCVLFELPLAPSLINSHVVFVSNILGLFCHTCKAARTQMENANTATRLPRHPVATLLILIGFASADGQPKARLR